MKHYKSHIGLEAIFSITKISNDSVEKENLRPLFNTNIAKGTTDLRVEFITSFNTNLDEISISESRLSINFKISTKHQYLD